MQPDPFKPGRYPGLVAIQRFRLALALVVALLLHLFLVFGLTVHGEKARRPIARQTLQLRLVRPKPVTTLVQADPRREKSVKLVEVSRLKLPKPRRETSKVEKMAAPASKVAPAPTLVPIQPLSESPLPWLPSLEVLEVPDLTYYPAADLDVLAKPLEDIKPFVPLSLDQERNPAGRVVLRIKINESGEVDEAEVESSDPPGVYDQPALTTFRAVRFVAAVKNGKFVRSEKRIEVTYGDYHPSSPATPTIIVPGSGNAGELPRSVPIDPR